MSLHRKWAMLLIVLLPFANAAAQNTSTAARPPKDPVSDPLMVQAGFLSAHPDLRYRKLGMESMEKQRFSEAIAHFRHASRFADKPSQGMVAEMLWAGQGAPQDRALAYVWMDMAAERGYIGFLAHREKYWAQLDEAERARAVAEGQALYDEYGDAVAKPRLAAVLRRARRQMTGSRTGFIGSLQIQVPGPGGSMQTIDGATFYDPTYWDPDKYQAWHDAIWSKPKVGMVRVGELGDGTKPAQEHDTRTPRPATDVDAPEVGAPDVEPPAPQPTPH